MKLYPLKFKPILKERIWGGTKLGDILRKQVQGNAIGESWELSGVEGDISEVVNGPLKSKSLDDLITLYGESLLGKSVMERFGSKFPILIKFLDAKENLSIQLHPNDALAQQRHNSFGKTEMWHILQADKDSSLIVGFNKNTTKEEYFQHLQNGSLLNILHNEPVKKGDTFIINPGKVHAIGAGILLAEIQQTSDITYRIFDFNRKDKNGHPRELHTDLALDAIDYEMKNDYRVHYSEEKNTLNPMVNSPYFITNFVDVSGTFSIELAQRDSFSIYICTEGEASLNFESGTEKLKMGDTVLVPAILKDISLSADNAHLLEVHL